MIKITIDENQEEQRLDRFLKKYFRNAPLSYLYKLIRKSVKVNGKRVSAETQLALGDEIVIYMDPEEGESYRGTDKKKTALRQFRIAYEDSRVLVVEKPFGLLTHGTAEEKKNTLANQVIGYLIETEAYRPGKNNTFIPSPVNRLDRNTTGLVVFGKDYAALKALNQMFRAGDAIRKYYTTIVSGRMDHEIRLTDRMVKNAASNRTYVLPEDSGEGKRMETIARPLAWTEEFTLVEVELLTGRSHQIRAHLASAGFPVIGDAKYGRPKLNREIGRAYGLTTQFLHASRLRFEKVIAPLEELEGTEITAELPEDLEAIRSALFSETETRTKAEMKMTRGKK